jgi:1,4-alpha-glucan branching enzyme
MSEFGAAFDRAQAAYDAREPEGDHDCEEDSHSWKRIRSDDEGNVLFRCRYCGKEEVT